MFDKLDLSSGYVLFGSNGSFRVLEEMYSNVWFMCEWG